jgi:hypothetical protein
LVNVDEVWAVVDCWAQAAVASAGLVAPSICVCVVTGVAGIPKSVVVQVLLAVVGYLRAVVDAVAGAARGSVGARIAVSVVVWIFADVADWAESVVVDVGTPLTTGGRTAVVEAVTVAVGSAWSGRLTAVE